MLKKLLLVVGAFLCMSCVARKREDAPKICPLVSINENSYTKIIQHVDAYEISLDGYHGDCIISTPMHETTAVIQPVFTIRRLKADGQVNVPLDYYVESPYGRMRQHVIATLPEFEKEVRYLSRPVKIPLDYRLRYETVINLGLIINPPEQIYNNRYFYERFSYNEED